MENTIVLTVQALRDIAATSVSASTDRNVPILAGINLRVAPAGGMLLATATDRYSVLFAAVAADNLPENFDVTIDAKATVAALKSLVVGRVRAEATIFLTVGETHVTLSNAQGDSVTVARVEGNYPAVDRLVPNEIAAPASTVGLNANLLTRMDASRKISKRSATDPWRIGFAPGHTPNRTGALVAVRENFTFLLQPNWQFGRDAVSGLEPAGFHSITFKD